MANGSGNSGAGARSTANSLRLNTVFDDQVPMSMTHRDLGGAPCVRAIVGAKPRVSRKPARLMTALFKKPVITEIHSDMTKSILIPGYGHI